MSADYGEGSGPQREPRLLTRIGRRAQRVFDGPPWLAPVLRAAVFLAGDGAIWLLVRGQHPYRSPKTGVLAVVLIAVAIATAASVKSLWPPSAGWAQKQKDARAAVLPAYLGAGLLIGALGHAGAGRWLVYGVLPATACCSSWRAPGRPPRPRAASGSTTACAWGSPPPPVPARSSGQPGYGRSPASAAPSSSSATPPPGR